MAAWDGDQEFNEEEVWGLAEERDEESNPKVMKKVVASKDSSGFSSSSSSSAWHSPALARKIPRSSSQSSHKFEALQGSSAPLNIPDWSKIYQKSVKRGEQQHEQDNNGGGDEEEDEDGDEDRIIPPHEWLARKLARNQISSFSVCEGVGRTLKGRDLSKVRNAILSKTGFIE